MEDKQEAKILNRIIAHYKDNCSHALRATYGILNEIAYDHKRNQDILLPIIFKIILERLNADDEISNLIP